MNGLYNLPPELRVIEGRLLSGNHQHGVPERTLSEGVKMNPGLQWRPGMVKMPEP